MHLEKIILTNFKNYAHQTLTFSARLNAFVGLNGMGKTNILDAIYYLCMCKSYFLPSDADVILTPKLLAETDEMSADAADFMRLEGHFQKNGKLEKIVSKVQTRKKKVFERNDVAYTALSDHIGFLPVVMIAPDDTELVKEGSEARRRFLDNALSQIDNQYLTNLIFYNKIVEQRNATLKKYAHTEGVAASDLDNLLDVYDRQMAPSARYIFDKRAAFIRDFEPVFNRIYGSISDAHDAVSLTYESGLLTASVENLLSQSREKDRILQRTTAGVHRDDLTFQLGDKPLKKFGSQGQLKSFVVALKLAQFELLKAATRTDKPLLLLDDIFDKLDENRVQNLLQLIVNQSFGQIFITDTSDERVSELFDKLGTDFKKFTVRNGVAN